MNAFNSKKIILIAAIVIVMVSTFFAFTKSSKPVPAGTGDVKAAAINITSGSEQPSGTIMPKPSSSANSSSATSSSESSASVSPKETVKPEKAPPAQPVANTAQDVFNGYFIDQDCFIAYEHPWEDNIDCLQMESCAASGYGIALVQKDGSYNFFYFDGNFSPNATNGQIQADKLIKNTQTIDHIYIEIKGKLTNDKKVAANGQSYGIIKVTSMKEIPAPSNGQ